MIQLFNVIYSKSSIVQSIFQLRPLHLIAASTYLISISLTSLFVGITGGDVCTVPIVRFRLA